jgi:acyl-CoA thioesterase FadM
MTPDDFPVQIRMPVAWGHLDAFGHVNNTVYLSLVG